VEAGPDAAITILKAQSADGRSAWVGLLSAMRTWICIEEPFSGQLSSVKALYPMLATATHAFELEGLPWGDNAPRQVEHSRDGKGNQGA
jgi:hypothetical protein